MKTGDFPIAKFDQSWIAFLVASFRVGVPALVRICEDRNAYLLYSDGSPAVAIGIVDDSVLAKVAGLPLAPKVRIAAPAKPAKVALVKRRSAK